MISVLLKNPEVEAALLKKYHTALFVNGIRYQDEDWSIKNHRLYMKDFTLTPDDGIWIEEPVGKRDVKITKIQGLCPVIDGISGFMEVKL